MVSNYAQHEAYAGGLGSAPMLTPFLLVTSDTRQKPLSLGFYKKKLCPNVENSFTPPPPFKTSPYTHAKHIWYSEVKKLLIIISCVRNC